MNKSVLMMISFGIFIVAGCGEVPALDDAALSAEAEPGDKADGTAKRKIAARVTQSNLVADEAGAALSVDPNLRNAWGIAFNSMGGAWVSDNHSGVTSVYDATGALKLTVTLP